MKRSEIVVGGIYEDKNGSQREVIAEGPEYVLYSGQEERDNLRYRLLKKMRGPLVEGQEYNSTRLSFANWAARLVSIKRIPRGNDEALA